MTVITNDLQYDEVDRQIRLLHREQRTDEQNRELEDLIAAVEAWRLSQEQPLNELKDAGEYERAKARIAEVSDALEGTPEAVELARLVEAVRLYEDSRLDPQNIEPGRIATP